MTRPHFFFPEQNEELTSRALPLYEKRKSDSFAAFSAERPTLRYGDGQPGKHFAKIADAWLEPALSTLSRSANAAHPYSFAVLYRMLSEMAEDLPIEICPFPKDDGEMALPIEVISHGFFFAVSLLLRFLLKEELSVCLRAEKTFEEGRIYVTFRETNRDFLPDREVFAYLQGLASRFRFSLVPYFSKNENGFCFCLARKVAEVFRFFAISEQNLYFFFRLPEGFL